MVVEPTPPLAPNTVTTELCAVAPAWGLSARSRISLAPRSNTLGFCMIDLPLANEPDLAARSAPRVQRPRRGRAARTLVRLRRRVAPLAAQQEQLEVARIVELVFRRQPGQ